MATKGWSWISGGSVGGSARTVGIDPMIQRAKQERKGLAITMALDKWRKDNKLVRFPSLTPHSILSVSIFHVQDLPYQGPSQTIKPCESNSPLTCVQELKWRKRIALPLDCATPTAVYFYCMSLCEMGLIKSQSVFYCTISI